MREKLSETFVAKLNAVTSKRPKTVIQHILKHGFVTTEELKKLGYEHAPRAARDVRELGIPLETFYVKDTNGRRIGAYRFGDPSQTENKLSKTSGRTVLSKALKKALIEKYGSTCFIYLQPMEERFLQVDHRVPYEIGGEQDENDLDCYMLLSPSANRAKSWTCEHCSNWKQKDASFCVKCFWAHPENYTHIAGKEQRQIIITFTGDEIEDYNKLIALVGANNAEATIKKLIDDYIK
ncbi:MAG: HNH endonuclease [Bacteroidaceae bacterium]|nr:HNH endonuclease [Bacteroidaceae bacterium]